MVKWIKKILYIEIAIVLVSIGINWFLGPHNIAAGGLTGLAIIFERLFNLDRFIVILIGNIIVLIITYVFLGREVFLNTVIGAGSLPFVIGLIPHKNLVSDPMLAMIVGSVIFGIGVAILYNNKASSGGTAVPPLIFKKYFNLNTAVGLFLTDGVVVTLCLFVFDVNTFFYAVLSIFITSVTMNYIETGINKKKMVYIISDKNELISNDILHELSRGVTIVPVIRAYKNDEMQMLLITLDMKDYHQLISIVNRYDEKAFIIADSVSDVHGHGFTYESRLT